MAVRTGTCMVCLLALLAVASPAALAGEIGLSWNASPGATGYRLFYGPSSRDVAPYEYAVNIDVGNTTSWTISDSDSDSDGLEDCQDTYFAVKAYNDAGSSGFSDEVVSWPRPAVSSASPASAKQGTQVTLSLDGANFRPGTVLSVDNPNVFLGTPAVACNQIQVSLSVEPTAQGVRPAEIGVVELTVTTPNNLLAHSQAFTVEIEPSRFDINRSDATTAGRLDGKDTIWLSRLFGVEEGASALYDPDYDFDGDGWVDGGDLAYLASGFGGCWSGSGWTTSACP